MSRTHDRLTLCAVVWLTLIIGRSKAQGQQVVREEGAIVFGEQKKLPLLSLERPTGSVDFLGTYSADETVPKVGLKSDTTTTLLQETLTLNTVGHIVHPNLVDLHLGGTFGLAQEWFDSNQSPSSQSNDTIYAWDVNAAILRESDTPLTLYTHRAQSFVDRSFGPTIQDTQTTYGAALAIRSKAIPTDFRIERNEETQSGLGGSDDFTLRQDIFQWHSEAHPTENQALAWDYTYNQSEQTSANGTASSSDGQSAFLGHSILFGPAHRHSLDSTLTWTDTTGVLSLERTTWTERLRLRHTETFETDYDYRLEQQDTEGVSQTLQRATAGFRHRLYNSLVTTGRAGWQNVELSDNSTSEDWFASLNFNYQKRVPYGKLIADMGASYDQQSNSLRSGPLPVVNQSLSLIDFQPFTLAQQNVVPASVVIRDATSGRIFTPGIDYFVTPLPGGLQLTRTPGGAIVDGQPLLLNYNLGAAPPSELTTTGFGLGLRYQIQQGLLQGLGPYVRYHQVDQTIRGGGGTLIPANSRDYIIGVDYHLAELFLRAEHETFDAELFPFDANRFEARWDHRVSSDTTFALGATYTLLNYPDQNNQTDTLLVSGSFTRQLARDWSLTGTVSWINVEDQRSGRTQGLEESLELRWRFRQFEAYARVRNSQLNSSTEDRSFEFFQIGLKREF